jgi:hypothetical protein
METPEITGEHLDLHVAPKLRNRIRLYLVLSLVILGVIIYRLFLNDGTAVYSVGTFFFGIIAGVLFSRMYKISWDENAQKVVSRLDMYGGILLGAYVVFEVVGEYVIRQNFVGPAILTMVLSLAGGALLGRGIGMGRTMVEAVRESL